MDASGGQNRKILLRPHAVCLLSACGLCLLCVGYPQGLACAQEPKIPEAHAAQTATTEETGRYAIYELGTEPALKSAEIERVVKQFGLESAKPVREGAAPKDVLIYTDKDHTVRLVFRAARGSMQLFPNFYQREKPAPPPDKALELAQTWADENGIVRAAGSGIRAGEVTSTARSNFAHEGGKSEGVDVLRTIHFYRQLDGLRVFGKNSILSVNVGAEGVVGVDFAMRSLVEGKRVPARIISTEQAVAEFHKRYDAEFEEMKRSHPGYRFEMAPPQLIYFEQGLRYVQPVYRFVFRLAGPKGVVGDFNRLIPASLTPPEEIISAPAGESPKKAPAPQRGAAKTPEPPTTDPILLGAYIIQNSQSGWLDDGWAFLAEFQASNALGQLFFGFPPSQISQYYWDEVWLWEAYGSIPDNSQYYPGAVNFAVHEGHGNMWETASIGDWSKVIYLPQITGYGSATGKGEITNYLLWKGCAIIPAPGDPYCADYNSPAQWSDVWFTMFQGMRGAYGFRTEMWIDDEAGGPFGSDLGLGVPNLNAWFQATDNSQWDHDSGLNGTDGCPFPSDPGPEYGDAVIICGHENDRAYDTGNVPPASCLTIWWQHK
jgi:hypothetical protein